MAIYVVLACLIALFWCIRSMGGMKDRTFLILSFGLMALVLGFRGSQVGEDTASYLEIASISKLMSWNQVFSGFPLTTFAFDQWGFPRQTETAFLALNKFVMGLTDNPQSVLILCAAVTCWGFGRFIAANSRDVGQSTWIFLCDSMFIFGFNGMRQLMAMALALQFYSCFCREKYVRGFLWIAFASMLHTSCLFFFLMAVLYFVCRGVKGYRALLVCVLVWPAAMPLINAIVSAFFPRYALYMQVSYWNSSLGGFAVVLLILASMIIFYLAQSHKSQEDRYLIVNAVLYFTMEIVAQRLTTLSRMALMPRSFLTLFYPCALKRIDKKTRTLIFMALNVVLFLLYLSTAASPSRAYVPFWD